MNKTTNNYINQLKLDPKKEAAVRKLVENAASKEEVYNILGVELGPAFNGIYVYDIDDNCVEVDKWDTANNDKAVGVAVIHDKGAFVVAKEDAKSSVVRWGGIDTDISTLTNYTDVVSAATDFDGINNTSKIIATIGNTDDGWRTGSAAQDCVNYIFPNGQTGYLGAAGEWNFAYSYKDKLNSTLELIGGTKITYNVYWTSTECDGNSAWVQSFKYGETYTYGKQGSHRVRAFLAIDKPYKLINKVQIIKEKVNAIEIKTEEATPYIWYMDTAVAKVEELIQAAKDNRLIILAYYTYSFSLCNVVYVANYGIELEVSVQGRTIRYEIDDTEIKTKIISTRGCHYYGDNTLNPDVYNEYGIVKNNITFTINIEDITHSDYTNFYQGDFSFGETVYTVTFPDTIKWSTDSVLEFKANHTYQFKIVNNLGVMKEFANS